MSYSSISKDSGSISAQNSLPIYYDLYVPVSTTRTIFPIVLFIHGFKGFKDWGAFPDACEELAKSGFAVIAFNHSRNGIGDNMLEFDEPELFEKQTLSGDLDDIGDVIKAIESKEISHSQITLNTDKIGIIGHSRGGHTAVAAAAEYSNITCLVTWSAVADYNKRWSDKMVSDWNKKGYTEIENARTGQIFKIDVSVYNDAIENADHVIALNRVRDLHIPALFIAGKDDEAVPYSDSESLFRACPSDDKEVRLIENAGHTFEVSHPFEEGEFPEPFSEVLNLTESWLLEYID